jgi:hypothetical protein
MSTINQTTNFMSNHQVPQQIYNQQAGQFNQFGHTYSQPTSYMTFNGASSLSHTTSVVSSANNLLDDEDDDNTMPFSAGNNN